VRQAAPGQIAASGRPVAAPRQHRLAASPRRNPRRARLVLVRRTAAQLEQPVAIVPRDQPAHPLGVEARPGALANPTRRGCPRRAASAVRTDLYAATATVKRWRRSAAASRQRPPTPRRRPAVVDDDGVEPGWCAKRPPPV
jgi:hypothetical protein